MAIKEYLFPIRMDEKDYSKLMTKTASLGMTEGKLLSSFIGDFTDGIYSNGSDERNLIDSWIERRFFPSQRKESFLKFLSQNQYHIEFITKAFDSREECAEDEYPLSEFIETFGCYQLSIGKTLNGEEIEKEISKCRSWLSKYKTTENTGRIIRDEDYCNL